jgi:microcystin-dependent protein
MFFEISGLPLRPGNGIVLPPGTTISGDGSGLTNLPSGGSSPTGTIVMYGGGSAPSGWLLCDGAAVSRSTYSALWNVLGSSYGNGNGSTTFNVPNFISGGPGGTPAFPRGGNTRGNTGGQDSFILTVDNIPIHNHGIGTLSIGGSVDGGGAHAHTVTLDWSAGTAGSHQHNVTIDNHLSHNHGVGDYVIGGSVGSGGAHSHTYTAPDAAVSSRQGTQTGGVVPGRATGTATSSEASHQHGAGTLALSGTSANGGAASHSGTMDSKGGHTHAVTATAASQSSHQHGSGTLALSGNTGNWGTLFPSSINNQPPYVVVNFIIKT